MASSRPHCLGGDAWRLETLVDQEICILGGIDHVLARASVAGKDDLTSRVLNLVAHRHH